MREYHVRPVDLRKPADAASVMRLIGTDTHGISLMRNKMVHYTFRVGPLPPAAANIIKQEMLAVGGEAAVARGVINCCVDHSDALLGATRKQYHSFCRKLRAQPFSLAQMADKIEAALRHLEKPEGLPFRCRGLDVDLKQRPLVMGILNVTPDSFSDGNRYLAPEKAREQARKMIAEGADIIDIGGESTRPGAAAVEEKEELERVLPVLSALRTEFPNLPLSIDTYKSRVAAAALQAGADLVNDISAGNFDSEMAGVVAANSAWFCLMHIQGTPRQMQINPRYDDLFAEINAYFAATIAQAEAAGVPREKLILDPGIGFGKTLEHNLLLLKHLKDFSGFGLPLLIGVSRKSFIGKVTGTGVDARLPGSLAAAAIALDHGAHILRVHDVAATRQAVDLAAAINQVQR